LKALTKADRKTLAALGLRLGAVSLFMPKLQHPRMLALRARLWSLRKGCPLPGLPPAGAKTFDLSGHAGLAGVEDFCHAIGYRRVTRKDGSALAVRADVLERLAREVYKLAEAAKKPENAKPDAGFAADPALCSLADSDEADLEALLFALGYRRAGAADGTTSYVRKGPNRKRAARKRETAAPKAAGEATAGEDGAGATAKRAEKPKAKRRHKKPDPALAARKAAAQAREEKRMADSPFAILRQLAIGGE
jgi:ATP-dependent RNA helicase SUPV3L1/SUV3